MFTEILCLKQIDVLKANCHVLHIDNMYIYPVIQYVIKNQDFSSDINVNNLEQRTRFSILAKIVKLVNSCSYYPITIHTLLMFAQPHKCKIW